ncbi:cache domain-containing sensor histidine kinase [Peribacillus kribbensis]|uniref:cache domain-containing sensor histidine kinase n=1 Tax=Peribacillus kribbensis TaxID=356658 RepID=UPI000415F9E2|nr:sensor histidine kinase [Peribacillus kribbensis]
MKLSSLQSKLTIFYVLTIIVPVLIISFLMPFYYQDLMEKETETLTETTVTSAGRNIETYLEDLERITIVPYFNDSFMNALETKASADYPKADLATKMFVEKTLSYSLSTNFQNLRKDIVGTIMLTTDNSLYIENTSLSSSVPYFPFTRQDWYHRTISLDGKAAFIGTHEQNYLVTPAAKKVFSVARQIRDPETHKPLAVIMADSDTAVLDDILGNLKFNVKSFAAVLNEDNELFYSNHPFSKDVLKQIKSGKTTIKGKGDTYVLVSKVVQPADWKIVVLLSKSELSQKVKWFYFTAILFAIGGLILTLMLFSILSRWIVKPFRMMMKVMKKVERGDLDVRIHTSGHDEITHLGNSFNAMISRINELINREYRAVIKQRNAEFRALQSQIQPHFLFNTLSGFIALNRIGDRKTLEKAILSLSQLLRYSMGQEEWTTVRDSFELLQSYCRLQQLRFQDRLTVEFYYDEELANYLIPKLIIQPFVENSIIHGIEPSFKPCRLTVSARLAAENHEKFLSIRIEDDGIGFNPERMSKSKGTSIGISNVRDRLDLLYQNPQFIIDSAEGKGAAVIIKIPAKEVRKNENLIS